MSEAPESAIARMLPAAHDAPRCSPHARGWAYDPGGTAIAANAIALVDLPPPWPKPVFAHPLLAGITRMLSTRFGTTRVLAALPDAADAPARVRVFRRIGATTLAEAHMGSRLEDVPTLLEALQRGDEAHGFANETISPEALLVCAQGTHDVCCGIEGTRFAAAAAAAFPDLEVVRVSHTGGHRFAPTAMTLPNGRMWANLDLITLAGIHDQSLEPAEVAGKCRGWWGADQGAAQIAERAVFAAAGWSWEDEDRTLLTLDDRNGAWSFRISGDAETWQVDGRPRRTVPIIACRAAGGLPTKPWTEHVVTSVRRL